MEPTDPDAHYAHPYGHDALHAHDEILAQRADQLAATVSSLRAAVTSLDERAGKVEQRASDTETKATELSDANRRAAIGLVILALIVAFGGWMVWNNHKTVARLDTSVHEQCSLYSLLIPSFRGAPPAGSPISGQAYHDAYVKMQNSADALGCGLPHVVPGT